MSQIVEVPSVSLFVEYIPMSLSYRLTAEYTHGNSRLKCTFYVSDEQIHFAKTEPKFVIVAAVEEMAHSITKEAPWIAYDWLMDRLMENVDALMNSIQPGKEPLAAWEKELLASVKKPVVPKPKDYVDDAPKKKGLSQMADGLPGMKVQLNLPCECPPKDIKYSLKDIIMHINDEHAVVSDHKTWTSDQLCDWLDMLHDTGVVNLEVEIPDKEIKNADSN